MFIGEYSHSLDSKNRMIVPAKLREGLGEKFVITKGLDGGLYAYPISEWEMLEEKLADFNNVNITTGKSDEIPEIQAKINENVSTEKLFKTAKIFILEFAN